MIRTPPLVGVPCLTWWLPGPSIRICFVNPVARSSRMNGGIRITTIANASSRPWISSTVTRIAPGRRAPAHELVDEEVELDPARRLDEDDVAGHEPRRSTSRAASRVARPSRIRVGVEPGLAGTVGDRRRRPSPTTTSRSTTRPRPRADLAVAARRARRRARASRRGPRSRRPGSPAEQLQRGGDRGRRGVVAVVDDRHAARTDQLRPVGRAPAAGRARRRWRRGRSPAASPTAAAASALWTARRPSVGIATAGAPAVRRPSSKPIPSAPRDATASARTSASAANP